MADLEARLLLPGGDILQSLLADLAAPSSSGARFPRRTAHLPSLPPAHTPQVELGGRSLNIGRPTGYFEFLAKQGGGAGGLGAAAGQQSFQAVLAKHLGGGPTTVLLLSGLLPAGELREEEDRRVVRRGRGRGAGGGRGGELCGGRRATPPPHPPMRARSCRTRCMRRRRGTAA